MDVGLRLQEVRRALEYIIHQLGAVTDEQVIQSAKNAYLALDEHEHDFSRRECLTCKHWEYPNCEAGVSTFGLRPTSEFWCARWTRDPDSGLADSDAPVNR